MQNTVLIPGDTNGKGMRLDIWKISATSWMERSHISEIAVGKQMGTTSSLMSYTLTKPSVSGVETFDNVKNFGG